MVVFNGGIDWMLCGDNMCVLKSFNFILVCSKYSILFISILSPFLFLTEKTAIHIDSLCRSMPIP